MKSKEALRLLGVSRISLMHYVQSGKIKATKMSNGHYDYDAKSIYDFLGKKNKQNVIYARVSTPKQKNDLNSQIDFVRSYCGKNNIHIDKIHSEIASGISLDRCELQSLLDDVIACKINAVYVSYKDRLSRLSFSLLSQIFTKFGTNIVVVADVLKKRESKDYDLELFEDLISLMHYFSTKTYSHRKYSIFENT